MSKQASADVNNGTPKKKKKKRSTLKLTTPYRCKICKKYLADKSSLAHHTQTHSPSRRFSCQLCQFTCKTAKYLARHRKNVHDDGNTAACPVCQRVFKRKSLPTHMRQHTGEKPYKCGVCGKAFASCYSLSTHNYIHTDEKPFRCSFCEYACRDSSTLRKHEARHMGLERLYQCNLCDKRVKSKIQLKMHIAEVHLAVDIRKHECGACGKKFREKSVLNKHVREVHERRGRVVCALCGAALSSAANLPAHMLAHLDVRPYRCPHDGCASRFKDNGSLKKHLAVHDPALRLPCARCRRLFLRTSRLNEHRRARPQRCRRCARSFPNKCALWVHVGRAHPAAPRARPRRAAPAPPEDVTAPPALSVQVKLERVEAPSDAEDDVALADLRTNRTSVAAASEVGLDRKTARAIIQDNRKQLNRVPEEVFDELFIRKTMKKPKVEAETPENVDKKKVLLSKQRVRGLLRLARRVQAARRVRAARRQYHARLAGLRPRAPDKPPIKPLKIYNNNNNLETSAVPQEATAVRENETEGASGYTSEGDGITSERKDTSPEPTANVRKSNRIRKKRIEHIYEYESEGDDSIEVDANEKARKRKKCTKDDDSEEDGNMESEKCKGEGDKGNGKLKFNTHQCYVCFKLFQTRASLLEHCRGHFDVCSERLLKKCPFCPYVTALDLPRHVRLRHSHHIRTAPHVAFKEQHTDPDQARYYYDLGLAKVPRIDIVPSVSNLNKRACLDMDRRNRERRDKTLTTTKLVRKGKEWIVMREKLDVDLDDYLLPEIEDDVAVSNCGADHLSRMQALYRVAKKKGKRMLFPCEDCDKVCRTLSALKLHTRRHDPDAKPFRKKVWKHKVERNAVETGRGAVETGRGAVETGQGAVETGRGAVETGRGAIETGRGAIETGRGPIETGRGAIETGRGPIETGRGAIETGQGAVEIGRGAIETDQNAVDGVKNTDNRVAKPKPVKGRHRCDKQLIEFYESNIRGKDIEFWQFLKIYNKMDRENVSDFADLETRIDFGVHPVGAELSMDRSEQPKRKTTRSVDVARKRRVKISFTKSVLSKEQYSKRLEALKSLREKTANRVNDKKV